MMPGRVDQELAEEVGLMLRAKLERPAGFVRASKCTGAGISAAAGVFEFGGPSGIWTLQAKGKIVAKPDFTEEVASAWEHTKRADFALVLGPV